jgi:hypothetical protein
VRVWKHNNKKVNINRPKTSDASQFHQPPQDPSCNAHQDPRYKDIDSVNQYKFIFFKIFTYNVLHIFFSIIITIINENT